MKKISLLFVLLLSLTLCASAASIITEPKGKAQIYAFDANGYGWGGSTYTYSKKEIIYKDADTLYISCLQDGFDYSKTPAYVKGVIKGDSLYIPCGQPIYTEAGYGTVLLSGYLNADSISYADIDTLRFSYSEDEIVQKTGFAIGGHLFAEDESDNGWLGINYKVKFTKVLENTVTMPEGIPTYNYILTYTDPDDAPVSRGVRVGIQGSKVYIKGLAPDALEDCVVGVLNNGVLTVPSHQFLGGNTTYYLQLRGTTVDTDGNITDWLDNMTFAASADTLNFTMSSGDAVTENFYNHYEEAATLRDVKMFRHVKDEPAVPAFPNILDYVVDDEQDYKCFDLEIKNEDVDGNWINPDSLYYRMYKDGQLYTFKPSLYKNLTEDMTEIPYLFTDGYDFDIQYSVVRTIYLYETDWKKMSFDCVYRINGVENASDKVTYTQTGIEEVKKGSNGLNGSNGSIYNLAGQKVANDYRGIIICGGRKVIK